jgi:hypothetical protein
MNNMMIDQADSVQKILRTKDPLTGIGSVQDLLPIAISIPMGTNFVNTAQDISPRNRKGLQVK